MKKSVSILLLTAALALPSGAATIDWSASIDNGLSLANGTDLLQGSLLRLGYFRNSSTGLQLTDGQILALASSPTLLNSNFIEAASGFIGNGLASDGHFSINSKVDTSALGIAGAQIYLWAFNTGSLNTATQQGVFYWANSNTSTNPDASSIAPGPGWVFPTDDIVPGTTMVDLTDLTAGSHTSASGARLVIGGFGTGTSDISGAPNFNLAVIVPEPSTALLGLVGGATLLGWRRRRV